MPSPYVFIPNALPQSQAQRIYAEVGAPAPTSFSSSLLLISPDWSTELPLAAVTQWPADHGSALPAVGDQVLLEQDSRGYWRVASWGHATTTWGGVQLPAAAPTGANQTILSNGSGGSSWGTLSTRGTATLTSGTVTVANTSITAASKILLTAQDNNTTGALRISARIAGTSFTITSSNAADSGVVAYEIA
jgi:hypothetical protein